MNFALDKATLCVVGLGYVGLPLAMTFAHSLTVIAYDTNASKVVSLKKDHKVRNLIYTANPNDIAKANFVFICVPTPLTKSKTPDLSYLRSAAKTVGQNLRHGAVVIIESTVYPGVTEEVIKPILEKTSGLNCGKDFKIAYSPERINPGDEEHSVDKVVKVVAGMDEETTDIVAKLYNKVTPKVFKAKNIKAAEASKVIENTQRDLNIALMNELAIVLGNMGVNLKDVLDAAATKWNFHRYYPGLVGGYCIPVVPQYLIYKAKELGYTPQLITAARNVNDFMPKHVAKITMRALKDTRKQIKGAKVLVMGLTYKENVAEIREAPIKDVINELSKNGVEVFLYDPLISVDDIQSEYQNLRIKAVSSLKRVSHMDAVLLAVGHEAFKKVTLTELKDVMHNKPILIDIHGLYNKKEAEDKGLYYKSIYSIS